MRYILQNNIPEPTLQIQIIYILISQAIQIPHQSKPMHSFMQHL